MMAPMMMKMIPNSLTHNTTRKVRMKKKTMNQNSIPRKKMNPTMMLMKISRNRVWTGMKWKGKLRQTKEKNDYETKMSLLMVAKKEDNSRGILFPVLPYEEDVNDIYKTIILHYIHS